MLSLLLGSLALAAHLVSAQSCSRSYTVKPGDWCDTISAANNVSTYQLAAVNAGVINQQCDNLVIGSTLCLATTPEDDCTTTYVVSPGDTCAKIWDNSRVNATIFGFNNPQVDANCNLYIGQVVCVAQEVRVPPAPGVPIHTLPPAPAASTPVAAPPPPAATPPPATPAPVAPPTITKAPSVAKPPPAPGAGGDDGSCDADSGNDGDLECEEWELGDPNDSTLPYCEDIGVTL